MYSHFATRMASTDVVTEVEIQPEIHEVEIGDIPVEMSDETMETTVECVVGPRSQQIILKTLEDIVSIDADPEEEILYDHIPVPPPEGLLETSPGTSGRRGRKRKKYDNQDSSEENLEFTSSLLASYSVAMKFRTNPMLVRILMEEILQHVPHDLFPVLYWESISHLVHEYMSEIEQGNLNYVHALLYCVEKSYHAVKNSETERMPDDKITLCHAFIEVCWKVACHERISVGMRYKISFQCCAFIIACPELDNDLFLKFKSSLTMVFSTGLQIANLQTDPDTKTAHLRKMVSIFRLVKVLRTKFPQLCHHHIKRLFMTNLFEVYVLLKHPSVDDMMQRALRVGYLDAESLETMVATYHTHGGEDLQLMSTVLWKAIHMLRHLPQVDFVRISRNCRFIIQIAFHGDELLLDPFDTAAYLHCIRILSLIKTSEDRYPQDEVVWLMKKMWNYGIHNVASSRTDQARRWCFIAQSFLQEITLQRPLYERVINDFIQLFLD